MKITYTKFYCDICGKEMDYPRFINIKRKIFKMNIWGYKYDDVCGECIKSVTEYIRQLRGKANDNTN